MEETTATWGRNKPFHAPSPKVERFTHLLQARGAARYGGEPVSQLEHALQCAHLAEKAGAPRTLIVAALLHDLGHLLRWQRAAPVGPPETDDRHEVMAAQDLRFWFPEAVVEPIRLHVDAKRYLCATVPGYFDRLSPASQRSLDLQGGPFSPEEAAAFLERPFGREAIALRRWDDQAKDPGATPPELNHFAGHLEAVLLGLA